MTSGILFPSLGVQNKGLGTNLQTVFTGSYMIPSAAQANVVITKT